MFFVLLSLLIIQIVIASALPGPIASRNRTLLSLPSVFKPLFDVTGGANEIFDDWPRALPFTIGIIDHPLSHLSFRSSHQSGTLQQGYKFISILSAAKTTLEINSHEYSSDVAPSLLEVVQQGIDAVMICGNPSNNLGLQWQIGFAKDFLDTMIELVKERGFREFGLEIWQDKSTRVGLCEIALGGSQAGRLQALGRLGFSNETIANSANVETMRIR